MKKGGGMGVVMYSGNMASCDTRICTIRGRARYEK